LLDSLLAEPYFRQPPPKSAGREQYGKDYLGRILAWARRHRARPEDFVRTATMLTALSVADALNRWVLPRTPVSQLLVSGGGARNPLILAQLSAALAPVEVTTTEALGLPGGAKEAFIFALLADETLHGRPSNLPSATGARRPALLGKICLPPPR
jgi:anhydro-N-acetylmuramic acid kinase